MRCWPNEARHRLAGQILDLQSVHPLSGRAVLVVVGLPVQPHRIEKSRADHVETGQMALIAGLQYIADMADALFDLPERFPRTSGPSEQANVVGIGLQLIPGDQIEQGALAGAVGADQSPMLARTNGPIDAVQNHPAAEANRGAAYADQGRPG